MIEAETYLTSAPESLLREGVDSPDGIRGRFERVIRDAQDSICKAISDLDGKEFHEDAWVRPAGGGGISRVLQVRLLLLCVSHPTHPTQRTGIKPT